jgi:hypothetical protein
VVPYRTGLPTSPQTDLRLAVSRSPRLWLDVVPSLAHPPTSGLQDGSVASAGIFHYRPMGGHPTRSCGNDHTIDAKALPLLQVWSGVVKWCEARRDLCGAVWPDDQLRGGAPAAQVQIQIGPACGSVRDGAGRRECVDLPRCQVSLAGRSAERLPKNAEALCRRYRPSHLLRLTRW